MQTEQFTIYQRAMRAVPLIKLDSDIGSSKVVRTCCLSHGNTSRITIKIRELNAMLVDSMLLINRKMSIG